MKIVVCIKQSADGEINPFDASAYEAALCLKDCEVILLSMGPQKTVPFLESLTRLGAKEAALLCDPAFAGADTLATSYTLAQAIKTLQPDFVFCGRQSVDGDTGQVGPSLAMRLKLPMAANVLSLEKTENGLKYTDRRGFTKTIKKPAVIILEKSLRLRLPSLRSKAKSVKILSAHDLGVNVSSCGLKGSPTRVIKTFENTADRRNCRWIPPESLRFVIHEGLQKGRKKILLTESEQKLKSIWCVGKSPIEFAKTVGENITVIEPDTPQTIADKIRASCPDAVLFGSDAKSKILAPQVATLLNTGLCADCTALETDGKTLYMYRPACSGNIIAKIKCETVPPMATVRTAEETAQKLLVGVGYGVNAQITEVKAFAESLGAGVVATRKMVDNDYLPYEMQVGLTGKTVHPDVYLAVGISGAVHHIAGIKGCGTILAINPDRDAPIFKFADYGILADFDTVRKALIP